VLTGEIILRLGQGGDKTDRRRMNRARPCTFPPNRSISSRPSSRATCSKVSTPEIDDVVRLKDRYGRVPPK